MKKFVVMTTIRGSTPALEAFCRLEDWQVVVVADKKTPPLASTERCTVLSVEAQAGLGFRSYAHTPFNHYSRKNIGYLHAFSEGAEIIYDVDDDNLPHPNWTTPDWQCGLHSGRAGEFVNIYRHFTADWIWPRGFPLDLVRSSLSTPPISELKAEATDIGAWCGVVDDDADVDAIYRLVVGKPVTFNKDAPSIVVTPGAWCPFNSQNTFWQRRAAAALYLPISVTFRFTDILRSYVAQRLFWESGMALGFLPPIAYQERNPHDLMIDFADEFPVYLQTRDVVNALEKVRLRSGEDLENLIRIYEVLDALHVIRGSDLASVRAWVEDLEAVEWGREKELESLGVREVESWAPQT